MCWRSFDHHQISCNWSSAWIAMWGYMALLSIFDVESLSCHVSSFWFHIELDAYFWGIFQIRFRDLLLSMFAHKSWCALPLQEWTHEMRLVTCIDDEECKYTRGYLLVPSYPSPRLPKAVTANIYMDWLCDICISCYRARRTSHQYTVHRRLHDSRS
jgi:hypothetical protein